MTKYRKKPLVVDAIQLTRPKIIETLEGTMRGSAGDWLITGIKGEEYIIRADIFKESYELVSGSNPYNLQADREKVLDNLRKFLLAYSQGLPGFVYVYNVEEWINEEELHQQGKEEQG